MVEDKFSDEASHHVGLWAVLANGVKGQKFLNLTPAPFRLVSIEEISTDFQEIL